MEAHNATTVESNAGKEIYIASKGMSFGIIKGVAGERVKMETQTGKSKTEPIENVVDWIEADYTELR